MSAVSGATGVPIFTVIGTSLESLFGRAVCGVGNINGDAFGDFAVGIPNDDALAINGGRVLVYRGGVTDTNALQVVGVPSVSAAPGPSLRVLGVPNQPSLLLVDLTPGPTPIPPYGVVQLGFTAALAPLNDPVGFFGMPFGIPIDTQGIMTLGPFTLPPAAVGATLYMQAFTFLPSAPNGLFQRTNGLTINIQP